jgi:hypothetical protein
VFALPFLASRRASRIVRRSACRFRWGEAADDGRPHPSGVKLHQVAKPCTYFLLEKDAAVFPKEKYPEGMERGMVVPAGALSTRRSANDDSGLSRLALDLTTRLSHKAENDPKKTRYASHASVPAGYT